MYPYPAKCCMIIKPLYKHPKLPNMISNVKCRTREVEDGHANPQNEKLKLEDCFKINLTCAGEPDV